MQTHRIVFNTSDYLEHHGVQGQKWGVIRTPEQLGHKPKKTYEFKPYETYKTTLPKAGEMFTAGFRLPARAISESVKRHRDPEYKKKADEFIRDNKEMLTFRILIETGAYLPALIYAMNLNSKAKAPRMREIQKNLVQHLKETNPNISDYKLSRLVGVNKKSLRDLYKDLETSQKG